MASASTATRTDKREQKMEIDYARLGPPPGASIVIAGGAGGIGQELTRASVAQGLSVVVLDLAASIDNADRIKGVRYLRFDGGDPASIREVVADVSRLLPALDAFVFLSGYPILPQRPLTEIGVEEWDGLMAVNLRSAYLLSAGLMPLLMKATAPAVVTVASSLAYQVMPGMSTYATSKGGLVSLTKGLAMENAPKVRFNALAPGAVETSFLGGGTGREDVSSDRSWFDNMSDKYVASIPLRRVADPSDIVGPILFLLGAASAYMTGQVLHLNGGRLTP
jgi:NAD(P)-dependent dehydrogenase (short-subunit alcohol dehydrogenase family)